MNGKSNKKSLVLYILEASFEYLISILVTGSFLATLTNELGMSDSMTGIISSIISLGCVFQLFSIAFRKKSVKSFVIILSLLNQLLFMALYVIPFCGMPQSVKRALFAVVILSAYFIYNVAHPKKINWFMSLVDNEIRGKFTAFKEIISLIMGMGFIFVMGSVIDGFKAKGDIRTALILSAAVIFTLMVLHTLSMIFSIEKDAPEMPKENPIRKFISLLCDKNILRVTVVFILWNLASYSAVPFYGTYLIKELGMSLKYVSLLTVTESTVRICSSLFLGAYADKHSFSSMIRICFVVMCIGFGANIFAVPENGKIIFIIYYACHGFALAGINSSLINLVFDCVPTEKRADSLALSQALSGLSGFSATLLVSRLVESIQKNGNSLFGINIYAQQLTSLLSFLLTGCAFIYVYRVFGKKKNKA